MATTAQTANEAGAAAPKAETVAESMDQRRTFASVPDAANYLNLCAEKYTDFDTAAAPLVTRGMDEEGNFDPEVYTDSMRVLVAVLKNRTRDDKGNALPSTVKAIVVAPIPSRAAILASDIGQTWLDGLIDKELNHIAVRALRQADDVSTVADQIPTTMEGYVTSQRESGGIMESFDGTFKLLISAFAAKSPAWAKARLTKNELKKSFESAAYASAYYSGLEDRGEKESLFVMALQAGQKLCASKGLDPAIFGKWLETRNAKTMKQVADDAEDFDLDDIDLSEPVAAADATAATDSTETAELATE